jgi:5-methylcytosine-specific restriction enzyme A
MLESVCGFHGLDVGGRCLMPIRLCLEPRCPNPAPARGRCDEHRKPIERERSRRRREATNGVYKRKKWELTRRAVLARHPSCKVCDDALSTEVDHITPLADGGGEYDLTNLQGICSTCHRRKTGAENAGLQTRSLAAAACRLYEEGPGVN